MIIRNIRLKDNTLLSESGYRLSAAFFEYQTHSIITVTSRDSSHVILMLLLLQHSHHPQYRKTDTHIHSSMASYLIAVFVFSLVRQYSRMLLLPALPLMIGSKKLNICLTLSTYAYYMWFDSP